MFEANETGQNEGEVKNPAESPSPDKVSEPQPSPSTPTQPGGEPAQSPQDPGKPKEAEQDESKSALRPESQAGGSPLNYRVKIGNEEREMEDWAKPLLNAENEKQFRRLYEKAYGLDIVVDKLKTRTDEFTKTKTEHEQLTGSLNQLSSMVRAGDMTGFFEAVGISKEKVMKYVLDELNYQEMPADQRQARDQQMQVAKRAQQLEMENQKLLQQTQTTQEQYQQFLVQTREQQLGSVLSRPDVLQAAQAFDAREGRAGAFREEVIARATAEYYRTGSDLSPDEAVQRFMRILGHNQGSFQNGAQAGNGGVNQTIAQGNGRPPVIPSIGGKNTSAVRRSPRSLDELKQLADSLPG